MSMTYITSLTQAKLSEMYTAFSAAFKKYPISFDLSLADFERKFITKLNLDRQASAGVFDGERLVGFLFQTLGWHHEDLVAYNGGTGVLQDYRGRDLTRQMYAYVEQHCANSGACRFLLECLTNNAPAVRVYKACDFTITRLFHCFFLEKDFLPNIRLAQKVNMTLPSAPDWHLLAKLGQGMPAFEESIHQLKRNAALYTVVEARIENEAVGCLMFDRITGRVAYLCVAEAYRRLGIATSMLHKMASMSYSPVIAAVNIDEGASELIGYFRRMTFENRFDQYEMIRSI
ncbi:GNAT family N-acetyltransferase [Roseivirga sp. BDSF3-8]|uniref:GNAT family N-acetyltransferase n=1 Tax=Roseivirga sp. BDSF3-8 TaxID=3241598 RepID=UPI003532008D